MKKLLLFILLFPFVCNAATLRTIRVDTTGGNTIISIFVTDAEGYKSIVSAPLSSLPQAQRDGWASLSTAFDSQFLGGGETRGVFFISDSGLQLPASYGTTTRNYTDKEGNNWTDTQRTLNGALRKVLVIGYIKTKNSLEQPLLVTSEAFSNSADRDNLLARWSFLQTYAAGL